MRIDNIPLSPQKRFEQEQRSQEQEALIKALRQRSQLRPYLDAHEQGPPVPRPQPSFKGRGKTGNWM